MKSFVKSFVMLTVMLFVGHAAAQSVNISPSGVRIGADAPPPQTKGTEHAPGQLKKEYGGSATDYAPGQVKKDSGTSINFGSGDDKPSAKSAKSAKDSKGKSGQKGKKGQKNELDDSKATGKAKSQSKNK